MSTAKHLTQNLIITPSEWVPLKILGNLQNTNASGADPATQQPPKNLEFLNENREWAKCWGYWALAGFYSDCCWSGAGGEEAVEFLMKWKIALLKLIQKTLNRTDCFHSGFMYSSSASGSRWWEVCLSGSCCKCKHWVISLIRYTCNTNVNLAKQRCNEYTLVIFSFPSHPWTALVLHQPSFQHLYSLAGLTLRLQTCWWILWSI